MNFGISDSDLAYIVSALAKFDEIERASIFGSRAKGTHKPGSDIDIALYGDRVNFDTISKLHSLLEDESPMPYRFDIVDYSHLTHENLKSHIDRIGIEIYAASTRLPRK